jgi:hypothetical protein
MDGFFFLLAVLCLAWGPNGPRYCCLTQFQSVTGHRQSNNRSSIFSTLVYFSSFLSSLSSHSVPRHSLSPSSLSHFANIMPSAASLAENGLPSSRTKKSADLNIDVIMDPNGSPKPRQTKLAFTSSMYNNHSKKHDLYSKPYYYNQYGTSQKRLYQRWARLLVVVLAILLILSYLPFFTSAPAQTSTPPAYERPRDQKAPAFAPVEPSVRDQILLYRIIGNDLPPRHKEGQTLSNLAFILQHEQSFPNTRKIFLLNRIVDPVNEAAIIRLLDEYKMEYIRAPFHEDDYVKMDFRLEDFPEKDFLHSDDYMHFSKVAKLRTLDYTYHDKNLYAMNNVSEVILFCKEAEYGDCEGLAVRSRHSGSYPSTDLVTPEYLFLACLFSSISTPFKEWWTKHCPSTCQVVIQYSLDHAL